MPESATAIALSSPSVPLEQRLDIAGIPTLVVDPHHHVLPFWFGQLQGKSPAHLFHVDAHSDMLYVRYRSRERPVLPPRDSAALQSYVMNELHEGNFICPAVRLGLLHSIYHYNPRLKNAADVYKGKSVRFREEVSLNTVYRCGVDENIHKIHSLEWSELNFNHFPPHRRTRINSVIRRVNDNSHSLALDIDLDAFQCLLEPRDDDLSHGAYQRRLATTLDVLARMRKPSFITIARSQTPNTYVPPDKVDQIQEDLLAGLRRLYA